MDLTGALASILSVAQKDQRPRTEDEASAEQIKMVAGAATAFICSSLLLTYVRQWHRASDYGLGARVSPGRAKQSAILRKSNIGEDAPG